MQTADYCRLDLPSRITLFSLNCYVPFPRAVWYRQSIDVIHSPEVNQISVRKCSVIQYMR
jgi:hypothetical protein